MADWTRHPFITLPGELCENDLSAELAFLEGWLHKAAARTKAAPAWPFRKPLLMALCMLLCMGGAWALAAGRGKGWIPFSHPSTTVFTKPRPIFWHPRRLAHQKHPILGS